MNLKNKCHFCKTDIDNLSANPFKWGHQILIDLNSGNPLFAETHHACLMEKLKRLEYLEKRIKELYRIQLELEKHKNDLQR